MRSKNTPDKLSRRKWLRGAAITATGAVVAPSFLIGCSDSDDVRPVLGGTPPLLSHEEYQQAASNLIYMNAWVTDLYIMTGNYEQYVLHSLLGGKKPTDWKDFTLGILTHIADGLLHAAFMVFEIGGGPLIGPVLAMADATIKQFAFGSAPESLMEAFADFEKSHLEMQKAISDKLLNLADPGPDKNYPALQQAFAAGDLEFNGNNYTLQDLANAQFPFIDPNRPDEGNPAGYVEMRTAAFERFKRQIWNVMIMKAGTITGWHWGNVTPYDIGQQGGCVQDWAMNRFYGDPKYSAGYLRGYYREGLFEGYSMEYWQIKFDDSYLSEDAAREIFIDYTPGKIMNPDPHDETKPLTGFWPRDYVFKQFNTSKTDFWGYFDLAKVGEGDCYGSLAFDEASYDYEFTGGDFPQLIKI